MILVIGNTKDSFASKNSNMNEHKIGQLNNNLDKDV